MKTIDLSGSWGLYLDEKKSCQVPPQANDNIVLPDSTAHAGKLPAGKEKNTEPTIEYMTDQYYFEGHAWYMREIYLEEADVDKNLRLFLERSRKTSVYANDRFVSVCDSLCGFQEHDLTGKLQAGVNQLAVCVDNTNYPIKGGHMTSPDTQSNWNGIVGRMELQIRDHVYPDNLQVKTLEAVAGRALIEISAEIVGGEEEEPCVIVIKKDGQFFAEKKCEALAGKLRELVELRGEDLLWDEYHTNLFTAEVQVQKETAVVSFGIRVLGHDLRKLLVNRTEVFLRGKHEGLAFPSTGYSAMTVEEWKERFAITCKYGINHYRFHTCCPPEAAFIAADEMGIYLEPELPFWGTLAAPGEEQYVESEQNYLLKEGERILKNFGNHPSFILFSMGNELWGSRERVNEFMHHFKSLDDRHLYTQGSNDFQFSPSVLPEDDVLCGVRLSRDRLYRGSYAMCDAPLGHIQTDVPNSCHTYEEAICPAKTLAAAGEDEYVEVQFGTGTKRVKAEKTDAGIVPQVPVISHEIGQYSFFPDFDELGKYEGSMQPLYLEIYRERMEKSGVFKQWRDFYQATGALAVDCYKRELETAFRTADMSGFQILDLQDFPGQRVALVGILNSWMESKGLVTEEEWRASCNDVVLLGELDKFVMESGEPIEMPIQISDSSLQQLAGKVLGFKVTVGEQTAAEGRFVIPQATGRLFDVGKVSFEVPELTQAVEGCVKLWIEGTEYENTYSIFCYPRTEVEITEEYIKAEGQLIRIARSEEKKAEYAAQGERFVYIPDPGENAVEGTYCTDFWNYPMFRSISESMNRKVPVGTLGLFIQKEDALLKDFACRNYTTPQWYQLVMHSHCEVLDEREDVTPIVQPIDNVERCHKLGMLYRDGEVLVCTSRLWEIAKHPEVKWFALSLIRNM